MKKRTTRPERAEQYQSPAYRTLQSRLATNVRAARLANGWSQEEAAHRCSMATRLLQRVEAGDVNLTLTSIARLCRGLGIDAQKLFGRRPAARP